MTKTDRFTGGTVPRYLAILVAAVLGLSLMPATAFAAHNPNDADPCEDAPVANEYVDRNDARAVHRTSIDCVIFRAIAVGSTNEQGQPVYNPLNPVTRGQMASFIAQSLDAAGYEDDLSEGDTDRFNDISGNVHKRNINRLADAGIVRGVGGGRYAPGQLVSRQQMASFIVQAARFAVGDNHPIERDAADQFVDVSNDNVHKDNIEAGADAEPPLFRGETPTTFAPGKNVLRDQMATFLVNLLRYTFDPQRAPAAVAVTVESQTVAAGEPIVGTIEGAESATVAGECVENGAVADTDQDAEGIQFSIETLEDADGECELVFTIQATDGREVTRTVTVTVTGRAGVTERPELLSAEITEVDLTGTDAGTTIRYCFDEAIEEVFASTLYHAYNANAVSYDGDDADADTANSNCVIVFFSDADLRTQAGADALTVATVDFGAVQDAANDENPIGDAPLNGTQGGETTLPAGVTAAPDLTGVDVQGRIGASSTFETIFTFDERVDQVVDTQGFHLILEDGTQADCVAQETAPNDNTVDAECNLGALTNDADDVSRGFVEANTVEDASNNANPLQAVEAEGDDGNTEVPDLVSAQFFPSSGTGEDRVAYHFDEPVTLQDCTQFAVYDTNGDETFAALGQCVQDDADTIIVDFPDRTLEDMVGANVRDNAVRESSGAARPNQEDEVGVQNTTTTTGAGFTTAPDLIEVNVEERVSLTGTRQGIRATYTFDEDLETLNGLLFFLYEADGTRYQAVACELTDPTPPGSEQTVECTDYRAVDDTGAQISPDPDPRDEDVENAVLGTVDNDQVEDVDNQGNPEGAEPVTAA